MSQTNALTRSIAVPHTGAGRSSDPRHQRGPTVLLVASSSLLHACREKIERDQRRKAPPSGGAPAATTRIVCTQKILDTAFTATSLPPPSPASRGSLRRRHRHWKKCAVVRQARVCGWTAHVLGAAYDRRVRAGVLLPPFQNACLAPCEPARPWPSSDFAP